MKSQDYIVENIDKGTVTINGVITIEGHVIDTEDGRCEICQSAIIYYDKYDENFCAKCNTWYGPKCGDPGCIYCSNRPTKPLPNKQD